MKKNLFLAVAIFALSLTQTASAQTVATPVENPTACVGSAAGNCSDRWYELIEEENPPACDSARQNRETCKRWYSDVTKPAPAKVVASKIEINQIVYFDFNKSTIKPESFGILDDVVSVLNKNEKIEKVRIEGHTDSIGSDAYNEKLSNSRAAAVKNYLVSKGVSGARLESIGYGESRPVADNNSEEGRAKNRRTEFNIK